MASTDFYFGVLSPIEAEDFLRPNVNPPGSYLVHEEQYQGKGSQNEGLILCVKNGRQKENSVDHYKLKQENNNVHIIPPNNRDFWFATKPKPLPGLIDYLKQDSRILNHPLTSVCQLPQGKVLIDWLN